MGACIQMIRSSERYQCGLQFYIRTSTEFLVFPPKIYFKAVLVSVHDHTLLSDTNYPHQAKTNHLMFSHIAAPFIPVWKGSVSRLLGNVRIQVRKLDRQ